MEGIRNIAVVEGDRDDGRLLGHFDFWVMPQIGDQLTGLDPDGDPLWVHMIGHYPLRNGATGPIARSWENGDKPKTTIYVGITPLHRCRYYP